MSTHTHTEDISIPGLTHGVVVKPGETLVLSFRQRMNEQELYECTDMLKTLLPGVVIIAVDNDVRLTVLPPADEGMKDLISELIIDHFRKTAEHNAD